MQLIDQKYVPVSEYAHKECKDQLTASVRAAADASKNLALKGQGWAIELEQLDVIEPTIKTDPRILVSEDSALACPTNNLRRDDSLAVNRQSAHPPVVPQVPTDSTALLIAALN